jgi:UDP-GlcNAc:undecaprenyl-phosphate GlcNAc-1-phosphate transferase
MTKEGLTVLYRILKLLAAFIAGTLGVWLARTIARKLNVVSNPNPIVETHIKPIPYLGGAGVFLPYGVLLIAFSGFELWGILLAAGVWILLVMGTIDDLHPLPWWLKLVIETVLVSAFIPLFFISLGITLNLVSIILGIIAVVVITNGFNLIDVSDGLAAGVGGMISLGLFWAFLFYSPRPSLAIAPLLLVGVLGGFMVFNKPRASIFLGDGGSLPLGLSIGTMLVTWLYSSGLSGTRLIIVLSLASPVLFEMALTSFHRIRKGKSPFRGSPDHSALRLIKKGWGVPKVLLTALGVCAFLIASVALMWLPRFISWIYAGTLVGFYTFSFIWLSKIEVD